MRETRTYGSEGGEEQSFPTPIFLRRPTPAGRAYSLKLAASGIEAAQGLFEIFGRVYR